MPIKQSDIGPGIVAITGTATGASAIGIVGKGTSVGVHGEGGDWNGVVGISASSAGGSGVYGFNANGNGVTGQSGMPYNAGVSGVNTEANGVGVSGRAGDGSAIHGENTSWSHAAIMGVNLGNAAGVHGLSHGNFGAGVAAVNTGRGNGLWATSGTGFAGYFDGPVVVTGFLRLWGALALTHGDCAEDFDVSEGEGEDPIPPGTVMVLEEDGALSQSRLACDRRVAGVVSGAGQYQPGIVLDRNPGPRRRLPIALLGKACCLVDADHGPIGVGDLLTTSPTPGHAMSAHGREAAGATIGKAMAPLGRGRGLIPVLIALA